MHIYRGNNFWIPCSVILGNVLTGAHIIRLRDYCNNIELNNMLIVFNKRLIVLNNWLGKLISRLIVRFNRCIELFYRLSEFIIRLVTLFNRVTMLIHGLTELINRLVIRLNNLILTLIFFYDFAVLYLDWANINMIKKLLQSLSLSLTRW